VWERIPDHHPRPLGATLSEPVPFDALNAGFMDHLICRWETIIEHHIRLRHGDSRGGEVESDSKDELQDQLVKIDAEIARLRKEAGKRKCHFPLDQVVQTYGLDRVEAAMLELALVPHLDLSFRQRIARFNNNILLDVVDVDLAIHLLYPDRASRLGARAYLTPEAPLLANRLLTLKTAKDPKGSGLLGQELAPPARLADFVLCRLSLDADLQAFAELLQPTTSLSEVILSEEELTVLKELVTQFATPQSSGAERNGAMATPFPTAASLTLALAGPPGTGKTFIAHTLAHAVGRPLIVVDCSTLAGLAHDYVPKLDALFSEARVQGAVLLFDRCEPLFVKGNAKLPPILKQLERFGGLVVLTTSQANDLDPGVERYVSWQLDLGMPDVDHRLRMWRLFQPADVELAEDVDFEDLATRFEVTGSQIRNAYSVAIKRAGAEGEHKEMSVKPVLAIRHIREAAHAQIRANMEDYSVRSKVELTLDDLIVPDDELVLINEVLEACRNRVFVMSKWGFGKRLVTGKGICVLFKGEPGTGKTFCAEILAYELGMKLYQVSIPKIVSKYIGETEKNIAKIFHSARASHSMLLFDEADSLFAKRVAVENAVDRFSNMETNLLLQEIERFEGITILTTNLDKNIDDAFARRIQFKIDFPFPEESHRALIWKKLVPAECPISEGVDFDLLGENYELSGGHIKNAVVRAAYRAAARGKPISEDDIEFAAEQECKNAGKLFRTASTGDEW
jgi:SpoVK/Ycf46/Vps4 family AAA+-type ATPase